MNIQVTRQLLVCAEAVWAMSGDFGRLHRRHPRVSRLDLSWDGQFRTLYQVDARSTCET